MVPPMPADRIPGDSVYKIWKTKTPTGGRGCQFSMAFLVSSYLFLGHFVFAAGPHDIKIFR